MDEIFLMLIIFGANIVQALTGFAGTLLSMPLSIKLVGIDSARIIMNFISLFGSIYIMIIDRRNINVVAIKKALPWLLVGMIMAPAIYSAVDTNVLIYIYGIIIVVISLWKLFIKVQLTLPNTIIYLLVLFAGIAQGLFASGGPFLVVYMSSHTNGKSEFRTTLCTIWVLLCTMFIFQNQSYLTAYNIKLSMLSLIPLLFSLVIGNKIHKKISQEGFMKIAYILLLLSGMSNFIQA